MSATFDKYKSEQPNKFAWNYGDDRELPRIHAETVLLHVRFKDELELMGLSPQYALFRSVTQLKYGATWEKAFYLTGNCIRKHLKRQEENAGGSGTYQLMKEIFQNYLSCLKHGSQFFYQTLPFVFEKWFEMATTVLGIDEKLRAMESGESQRCTQAGLDNYNRIKEYFVEITEKQIQRVVHTLQPYQLLVVFPQLISRICHSHDMVFKTLTQIIVHVMKQFPQQTFWQMMQVSNSSSQRRRQRYDQIKAAFKRATSDENWTLLKAFSQLSDQLIKICQHKVEPGTNMLSLNHHFRPLEKMMTSPAFPKIILPFKDSLYPMLPNDAAMQVRTVRLL